MQDSKHFSSDRWNPSGHCTIFVCDIVSFGHQARHDRIQGHLRAALYEGLRRSFDGSGIPFDRCYQEDRGDGTIVVPPPDIDAAVLVAPLIDLLRGELRRHNEVSSDVAKIRLRVSLHIGEVKADDHGIVGTAVNHVNRLLDAPQFKEALNAAGAQFGLIVSAELYEAVIRLGGGLIDPDEYVPIDIQAKETRTSAWIKLSGTMRADERSMTQDLQLREAETPVSSEPDQAMEAAENRVSLLDLFEVVNRILDIPVMATPEGREQVVGSLRSEVAVRIPRRSQAHLDVQSILRTCLDFPGGLQELLMVLRAFAGDSVQIHALEETIDRLVSRGY